MRVEPFIVDQILLFMNWPSYALIARLIGPTWGPPGADRTQVGPILATWTLLSAGIHLSAQNSIMSLECLVIYNHTEVIFDCIWFYKVLEPLTWLPYRKVCIYSSSSSFPNGSNDTLVFKKTMTLLATYTNWPYIRMIYQSLRQVDILLSKYRSYLTNWGRATHICVSKLTIIGSDNDLSPSRRQAII